MIPQIKPWIDETELTELKRVIESTYVVEHDLTKEFERMTCELTKSEYAIATTNGTLALFCCLKALGIGHGDEVIVPDMTFIATSNSVIMAGAIPVFCDITANTFCIDPLKIESLITPRTKAIIPVHLYGQSADMDSIMDLAKRYNLKIIEDAAQGVGVKFRGRHVGTLGDIGILSYYGNKTITCGEGGMILTDDSDLAKRCYRLKNHGRDRKGIFIHEYIGFNFSFTEMQAAVGIAQMRKLPKIIERKRQIHDNYLKLLSGLDGFRPVYIDQRCTPVFWFTSFLSEDTEELSKYLEGEGIQTRRFFYPLHMQPCYQYMKYDIGSFPVSEQIYKQGISLPSSYSLTDDEIEYISQKIRVFYE